VSDIYLHVSVLRSIEPIYEEVFRAEIMVSEAEKYFKKIDSNFPSIILIKGPYTYHEGDVNYNPGFNIISIYVDDGLIRGMTDEQLKAFIFHAIGHFARGHLPKRHDMFDNCDFECEIDREIEADLFAVEDGHDVSAVALASLVELLAGGGEALKRIDAINNR